MFLDEKILTLRAGKGGDGASLFRREIYVPHGGPDGGNGGNGGNVYVIAERNHNTLTHLAHIDRINAEDGANGGHKRSTGKSGEDKCVEVPLGTQVYVKNEAGEWELKTEILKYDDRFLIAKGGSGGWGNWHFRSSITQAPERFNPGLPGEKVECKFILKLVADVGLVGLPNAGKSTLLSVITAAKPEIANYPFTTKEPQLGVVNIGDKKDSRHIVIADLPGLIEGASQGKGLGDKFLRHIERTKIIVHCISLENTEEEVVANYRTIRDELNDWSEELAKKKELIVFTKSDIQSGKDIEKRIQKICKMLKIDSDKTVAISAVSHSNLDAFYQKLTDNLQ